MFANASRSSCDWLGEPYKSTSLHNLPLILISNLMHSSFPLSITFTFSVFLHGFLMLSHLISMRFSRSNHLLMCLSLENSTSIIRTGYPNLMELIELVNSCYNFSISSGLLCWIYLFLLTLVFVLQWLSLNWKFWSSYCLSFHWPYGNSERVTLFHRIPCDCSCADWDDLHNNLRDVP